MCCLLVLQVICSTDFLSALLLLAFAVLWILVYFHLYDIRMCKMLVLLTLICNDILLCAHSRTGVQALVRA